MLKTCPECEHSVSEKALSCPACGYPFPRISVKEQPRKSKKKRRRLPNGFGQISEIKGQNLRKPFRAMITVAKDACGTPVCKLLEPVAYFETYNDAYQALMEFHKDPYTAKTDMTFAELYEEWLDQTTVSKKRLDCYRSWWSYCDPLKSMPISEIRQTHINALLASPTKQSAGEYITASPITTAKILELIKMVLRYAESRGYVDRNYAEKVTIPKDVSAQISKSASHHIVFTDDEMQRIWALSETQDIAKMILIQCYSGWRPSELLATRIQDIYDDAMHGGMKTEAGIDRVVPIHPKIAGFLDYFIRRSQAKDSEYVFTNIINNRQVSYFSYNNYFNAFVQKFDLNPAHKPHDPRKQFVTMCKNAGVDEYALKRLIGHSISDLTEAVYTDRPLSWLRSEIEKI